MQQTHEPPLKYLMYPPIEESFVCTKSKCSWRCVGFDASRNTRGIRGVPGQLVKSAASRMPVWRFGPSSSSVRCSNTFGCEPQTIGRLLAEGFIRFQLKSTLNYAGCAAHHIGYGVSVPNAFDGIGGNRAQKLFGAKLRPVISI